tara:strand:+ start:12489 stop:13001 length:513 start_codon:yes stop_codon:yes gene_type:complete
MKNKLLIFSLLIFFQVFVLNKIIFFDFLILSPLIIILLLYKYKKNSLETLLFAFFIGLVVDIFNDSLGVYSMVSIIIVYFRNFWILKIIGEEKTSELDDLSIHELGNFQYFIFSYPVISLYFTLLVFLESSSFLNLDVLAFILLSSSLNYVFMLVFQYLFLESKLSDEWG